MADDVDEQTQKLTLSLGDVLDEELKNEKATPLKKRGRPAAELKDEAEGDKENVFSQGDDEENHKTPESSPKEGSSDDENQ